MLYQEATLDTAIAPGRTSRRASPTPITVTISDTRKITGLGATKIYELIKEEKLKAVVIGRRRLVMYDSIQRLLQEATA